MSLSNIQSNQVPYDPKFNDLLDEECRIFKLNNEVEQPTEENKTQRVITDAINRATCTAMSNLSQFLQEQCRIRTQNPHTQKSDLNRPSMYWNPAVEKSLCVSKDNPVADLTNLYEETMLFLTNADLNGVPATSQTIAEGLFKPILPTSYEQLILDVEQKASNILTQAIPERVILLTSANGKTASANLRNKGYACSVLMRMLAHKILAQAANDIYQSRGSSPQN